MKSFARFAISFFLLSVVVLVVVYFLGPPSFRRGASLEAPMEFSEIQRADDEASVEE